MSNDLIVSLTRFHSDGRAGQEQPRGKERIDVCARFECKEEGRQHRWAEPEQQRANLGRRRGHQKCRQEHESEGHDKKVRAGRIRLVLPDAPGRCRVVENPDPAAVTAGWDAIRA